tara:strand:+ start:84 stop:290 length:207 start_codon:yes stop_codon:yes gene_type:complete
MFSTLIYIIILALGFILGYSLFDIYQEAMYNEEEYISITEKGRQALEFQLKETGVIDEVLENKKDDEV